ncbi:acyl-CoA dehydrogenase family protein [Vulgatibacter sp.]|uniref:acyl-CoA dehydrogenase family protein n=1 Tax=Vulgatibacter sp. TaxID=1971226 RepID=UPI00356873D4
MAARMETGPIQGSIGGGYLLEPVGKTRFLSPEGFSEEQRLFFKTGDEFVRREVVPNAERIEHKEYDLTTRLIREAGELGLLAASIPQKYEGLGLDETTAMIVAEAMARLGSWSVTHGGHTGIGTLPIVWFGNEAQKAKYLPKLATGEWIAAYALTEPGSGSDALGAKTTAVLSPDGKHYVLNGTKQWITNAGFADVFVVFAKIDGDKFTGFIVEKGTPGLTIGPEENKVGLRGSSTCQLIFEDGKVPVENVLGEIGKGHKIAFNILNNGRLKLGVGCIGGSKNALEIATGYAQERKAFGKSIAEFPLIREKLAQMVARIYAIESMGYRTSGNIDAKLQGRDHDADDFGAAVMAAAEEYAIESSILKYMGSEIAGGIIDEALQIHGGYGYMEEYAVARAWRDQRINRIFEGTNEINRMLVPGMLLKRMMKGMPLLQWFGQIQEELKSGLPSFDGPLAEEKQAAEMMKRLAGYAMMVAVNAFGPAIEERQEVLAALADVIGEAYAVDSAVGRTLHHGADDAARVAAVQLYAHDAWERALSAARKVVNAASKGDERKAHLAALQKLYTFVPYDSAELRETILGRVIESGGYPWKY